jgi:hypothetical protein
MITHEAVAEATCTCNGCPDQWEGTLVDGQKFYFRYRHGWASLGFGVTIEAAREDSLGERQMPFGDSMQGVLDDDERDHVFAELYGRS